MCIVLIRNRIKINSVQKLSATQSICKNSCGDIMRVVWKIIQPWISLVQVLYSLRQIVNFQATRVSFPPVLYRRQIMFVTRKQCLILYYWWKKSVGCSIFRQVWRSSWVGDRSENDGQCFGISQEHRFPCLSGTWLSNEQQMVDGDVQQTHKSQQ